MKNIHIIYYNIYILPRTVKCATYFNSSTFYNNYTEKEAALDVRKVARYVSDIEHAPVLIVKCGFVKRFAAPLPICHEFENAPCVSVTIGTKK